MELNLIHENSVNGLILPNCQTSEVFNYSKNWLIENNSNDMGLLTKSLFSKFGNDISVLGNGVIFQSMPQKGYSPKLNLTVNRILLDDILKDTNQYKNRTLFFGIEPFGHIDFFKNNLKKIDKNLFENL